MSQKDNSSTSALHPRVIRVSSVVDPDHKYNEVRSKLLNELYKHKYVIGNDTGDERITLDTMHHDAVIPSDAFVLLPIPRGGKLTDREKELRMKELFKASSLVVGLQTDDPYMHLDSKDMTSPTKPIVIIDEIGNVNDETWLAFHALLHGLHAAGTVKSHPDTLVTFVDYPEQVIPVIQEHVNKPKKIKSISNTPNNTRSVPVEMNEHGEIPLPQERRKSPRPKPEFNVCVFLSASTENKTLIDAARDLGAMIAEQGWGLVSGAGSTSMMGSVIQGAVSKDGWTCGTTMEYIAKHEGIPPNLDQFWYNDDIYTRMRDMIEASDSFVIMPGGMGTVQELFTLLLLKHEGSALMANADIVVCNVDGFWEPLIKLITAYGFEDEVRVVDTIGEVCPALEDMRKLHGKRITADFGVFQEVEVELETERLLATAGHQEPERPKITRYRDRDE